MSRKSIAALISISLLAISQVCYGQKNPREDDILYRTLLVRSLDLHWDKSKEVFGENNLFSVILFDAIMAGKIKAFEDESFEKSLSPEVLLNSLSFCERDSCYQVIYPEQLNQVEIGEYLVFDMHRSEHYFVPGFVKIMIPEMLNPRGLKEPWAIFRYQDCLKIFKSDPRAISQNRLIGGRKVNFADLLVMHAYYNELIKIGHDNTLYFDQQYQDKIQAFIASKDAEQNLINFLYRLYNPQ